MAQDDAQWVKAYQRGDARAFNRLYDQYERPLFSYLLKMIGDRSRTEDVFQQCWMKVIKALPDYREQQRFGSWLFGIAHHAAIDAIRQAKTQRTDDQASELLDNPPADTATPESLLVVQEDQARLQAAIERLPDSQRSVVLMRLQAELSFKEIAEIEHCSINTVLGRMHYAVNNLKKLLFAEEGGGGDHVMSTV